MQHTTFAARWRRVGRAVADSVVCLSLDVVGIVASYAVFPCASPLARPDIVRVIAKPGEVKTPHPPETMATLSMIPSFCTALAWRAVDDCLLLCADGDLWVHHPQRGYVRVLPKVRPNSLVFDKNGRAILVEDTTITALSISSAGEVSNIKQIAAGLQRCVGIALDSVGCAFVADQKACAVLAYEWSQEGQLKLLRQWGRFGTKPGQFKVPSSIAISSANEVFVLDQVACQIQVFDRQGTLLRAFGKPRSLKPGPVTMTEPIALAFDCNDDLYIGEQRGVQVLRPDGKFVTEFAVFRKLNRGDYEFDHPTALCITADGRIYVARRHSIAVFAFESAPARLSLHDHDREDVQWVGYE